MVALNQVVRGGEQAAVELSGKGLAWLNHRLEAVFALHGKIAPTEMDQLDWPEVPRTITKR